MIDLITADVLHDFKKSGNVYLIDVREQEEYDEAHIQGAHLMPLSTFKPSDVKKQDHPLVFYCRSGARSHHAAMLVRQLHPNWEIYNLEGGILSWIKNNYPVH
jgi:sulfur-carrier protein adenylyltransferase/sulfurtransferase